MSLASGCSSQVNDSRWLSIWSMRASLERRENLDGSEDDTICLEGYYDHFSSDEDDKKQVDIEE